MIQPILPSPYIQGVAVGEEGLATPLFHEICHRLGPVGPQEGQIARFTKVHFDGHELALHVQLTDPGRQAQAAELFQQAGAHGTAEIGIINVGCFHGVSSP